MYIITRKQDESVTVSINDKEAKIVLIKSTEKRAKIGIEAHDDFKIRINNNEKLEAKNVDNQRN